MTDEEIASIGKLADMCRAKGVRTLIVAGGIHMELEQPATTNPYEPKRPSTNEVDLCGCGCPEFAHINGACINGCLVEKCAPKEATA